MILGFSRFVSGCLSALAVLSLLNPFGTTVKKNQISEEKEAIVETVTVTEEEAAAENERITNIRKTYIPGVVCWGDSLTYGAGGNGRSYPVVLAELIQNNLTDRYDLKSIMNASDDSEVDWSKYEPKTRVPVINMGVGGERSDTICGRAGVIPFTIEEVTVPEDKTPVEITFEIKDGQQVAPLLQGEGGVNPVKLCDISGKLTYTADEDGTVHYFFSRGTEGDETFAEKGSVVETNVSGKYLDYIQVIMMGGNGGHNSLDELIRQYNDLLDRQTANKDRYIIVGYHGTLGALTQYENVEERFEAEYGDHYINLMDYFISEKALNDAEIEITDEIRAELDAGKCPSVFLSDEIHFNAVGYELIGKLIYDRMDSLGYFDEVKEAYRLDMTGAAD